MAAETEALTLTKRKLILRDSLAIFSLALATVVLFAITLFLFRSFSAHRADLAQRWSERGRAALQAGKPGEAIVDLRTALSYSPGTRAYELLLAEALGEAGDTDASYDYFMSLWDAEPGNGFVNLELARLSAKRRNPKDAVRYYRAAIYGTWEGDGVARRAEVRLELARYLIAQHDFGAARTELLIAGGNSPDDYDRYMTIGDLLQQAQDPADAWVYYQKAIAAKPGDPAALEAAGRLAYQIGDYEDAHRLLARALAAGQGTLPQKADDVAMTDASARILELMPSSSLPARERVAHVLAARAIAKKWFADCSAQLAPANQTPSALQGLAARWGGADGTSNAAALLEEPARQDGAMQLVYETEVQIEALCGPASGDDALLLRLATTPSRSAPPAAANSPATVGTTSEFGEGK